jgi:uncharacterized protein (DUF486 family)
MNTDGHGCGEERKQIAEIRALMSDLEEHSAAQLKTIQEVITLVVFSVFSVFYLKEELRWNYLVGFAFLIAAAFFIFKKW